LPGKGFPRLNYLFAEAFFVNVKDEILVNPEAKIALIK
jgi:hypothetical protein